MKYFKAVFKIIKIVFDNAISVPLIILSWLVPKKRGLVVLTSSDGLKFKDNPKYLYLYLLNNNIFTPCWSAAGRTLYKELKEKGMPVSYIYSIKHFLLALRAEFIVCDDTRNAALYDSLFWFLGRFKNILLWHGTGFKNIGLLDDKYIRRDNFLRSILTFFIQKNRYKRYHLITAGSEIDRERKVECFKNSNVYITGSPRNDLFFAGGNRGNDLKKSHGIEKYNKIILYAPTYRENNLFSLFTDAFWKSLQNLFEDRNYVFLIKKHSYDKSLKVPRFDNIMDITFDVRDVQEILFSADILISDYSSIVTDFALTGKPVIFYTCDFEEYTENCRGFYFDLEEVLPGPFAENENILLEYITDLNWFYDKEYQGRYQKFIDNFHTYRDGLSSERIVKLLKD